jgi:hypothetical protein
MCRPKRRNLRSNRGSVSHRQKFTLKIPNPYSATYEGSAAAARSSAAGSPTSFEASPPVSAGTGAGSSPAPVGAGVAEGPLPASDGGASSTHDASGSMLSGSVLSRSPRSSTSSSCAICPNSTFIQQNHTYPNIPTYITTQMSLYLIHCLVGPLLSRLSAVRAPHPVEERPRRPL